MLTSAWNFARAGGTTAGYVTATYESLFGRPPSSGELANYTNAMASGLTRAAFVRALQNSPEGRLTKVARWYRDELFATAPVATLKADPGVAHWAALLAGWTDADVQTCRRRSYLRYAAPGAALLNTSARSTPSFSAAAPTRAGWPTRSKRAALRGLARGPLRGTSWPAPRATRRPSPASTRRNSATSTTAQLKPDAGVAYWASFLGAD